MLKKIVLAGALAASAVVAAPAQAALVSNITLVGNCAVQCTGLFGNPAATTPTFDDFYTVTFPNNGTVSSQTQEIVVNGNLDFTRVYLVGPGTVDGSGNFTGGTTYNFTITNGNPSQAVLMATGGALAGNYRLYVAGNATTGTGYSGTIALAAVPETATWFMMIMGFGMLGFAMRRRNQSVTSTRATLNFA